METGRELKSKDKNNEVSFRTPNELAPHVQLIGKTSGVQQSTTASVTQHHPPPAASSSAAKSSGGNARGPPFTNVSTRVDRLLRERQMRRSQSATTLGTLNTTSTPASMGAKPAPHSSTPHGVGPSGTSLDTTHSHPSDSDMSTHMLRGREGQKGMSVAAGISGNASGGANPAVNASANTSAMQHRARRQSDSESEIMVRRLYAHGGSAKSPIPVPFPLPGGVEGITNPHDSLHGFGGLGGTPELLGDWRNLSADKLVLMGQESMTPVGKSIRLGAAGIGTMQPPEVSFQLPQGHAHTHRAEAPSVPPMSTTDQRLLVVANRLPLSAFKGIGGDWKLQRSSGGLVSALTSVEGYKMTWVGWPGQVIEEKERESLTEAFRKEECCPVYLDEQTTDLFYNGYCNSVLWQLFHYIALQQETEVSESQTVHDQYEAYKRANQEFLKAVMSLYQEGDIVWVHDYHLMLLPALLKEEMPNMKVGWFLHTPFPSSEIFRTLPQRDDILLGVLRADLVGFHTYDYARHFVSSCCRILGLEGTLDGIENAHMGTITRVAVFPIGIDPDGWINELDTPSVQARILEMRRQFSGRKVLLGVDRLDMVKGIPQKLLAFEKFLEDNPEWRNHVLLVQIAIPSRKDVPEYQKLTSVVHEMVGRINGRYGSLMQNPIHFLDCSLDFHNLCALYAVTDVLVVSSLRDGMNLVSYEFVACQSKDYPGVLVLSEFAGAAQSLGAGAILVNPYNADELSKAIAYALKMSDAERQQRHRQNFMHVKVHTAQAWGETFISELHDTHVEAALRTMHIPPKLDIIGVKEAYQASKSRLIVMGYNATLTTSAPAQSNHHRQFDQIRTLTQISEEVKTLLNHIASQPDTEVLVVSGSERFKLERIFEGINVWLAAENGIFLKPPSKEWDLVIENINLEWMESVQVVFDYFCERTPRSYVDTRETSLVWNCKYADIDFGRIQMRDMLQHLWTGPISNAQVEILRGGKSVEARPLGVTKGGAVRRIMQVMRDVVKEPPQFCFVAGHFMPRDEDIFEFFDQTDTSVESGESFVKTFGSQPQHIITCTVGRKHSLAKKHLKSSVDIIRLLHTLAH